MSLQKLHKSGAPLQHLLFRQLILFFGISGYFFRRLCLLFQPVMVDLGVLYLFGKGFYFAPRLVYAVLYLFGGCGAAGKGLQLFLLPGAGLGELFPLGSIFSKHFFHLFRVAVLGVGKGLFCFQVAELLLKGSAGGMGALRSVLKLSGHLGEKAIRSQGLPVYGGL